MENEADFKVNPNNVEITDSHIDFSIMYKGKEERIEACIPGKFSVYNAAGAIAVASYFDVTADEIRTALKRSKSFR